MEDPQSPACATTIFEGDNGGATTKGVSGTEIAVAIPMASGDFSTLRPMMEAVTNALFEEFNRRFEFYGRRLRPVFITGKTGGSAGTGYAPTEWRALATDIGSRQVFATLAAGMEYWFNGHTSFYQELARQGVVAVLNGDRTQETDRLLFDEYHPYVWTVQGSAEDRWRNLSSFICTSLAGHQASHAGNAHYRQTTRTFGILREGAYTMPSVDELVVGLRGCGVEPLVADIDLARESLSGSSGALARLKGAGITTVLCVCRHPQDYTAWYTANKSGYNPEFVFGSTNPGHDEYLFGYNDFDVAGGSYPIFITDGWKVLPIQADPLFQILTRYTGEGYFDEIEAMSNGAYAFDAVVKLYRELLLLASGIQSAGPMLTPQSFADGLMTAQFPNPGAGAAPYYQPPVGFGPGDHAMANGYAVAWFDRSLEPVTFIGQFTGGSGWSRGSFCYLGRGARFSVGTYPADADSRVYNPGEPCR